MDQQKIGTFLKELRSGKKLTQEQLAEKFGVSRRTVSRWETGSNMPDLDILIEMADYYEVDLRELLDGERKGEKMDKELEETVLKVADYSNEEKEKLTRTMHRLYMIGVVSFIIFYVLFLFFNEPEEPTFLFGFVQGITLGIPFSTVCIGAIMTSKYGARIRAFKKRILHRGTAL
ncbi:MAG: helix-turn-helix transcriptional regulator [Acetatifactor sp.]|nr:helix-turn-helix transcriptional regulator [Acetatifactor sp.]